MIKGAQTIAQYRIMQWVDNNFVPGSVSVVFTGADSATVTDQAGESMKVSYSDRSGITTGAL